MFICFTLLQNSQFYRELHHVCTSLSYQDTFLCSKLSPSSPALTGHRAEKNNYDIHKGQKMKGAQTRIPCKIKMGLICDFSSRTTSL